MGGSGGLWKFFTIGVANKEVGIQPMFIWLNGIIEVILYDIIIAQYKFLNAKYIFQGV